VHRQLYSYDGNNLDIFNHLDLSLIARWLHCQGDCITKVTVKGGLTAQAVAGAKEVGRGMNGGGKAVGMESR